MIYNQFKVVAVPFPFTDKLLQKKRPAVIISSNQFNLGHGHVVMSMITSTTDSWKSDVKLTNLDSAGLMKDCSIRFKIFTLPKSFIVRILGILGVADQNNLQMRLKDHVLGY